MLRFRQRILACAIAVAAVCAAAPDTAISQQLPWGGRPGAERGDGDEQTPQPEMLPRPPHAALQRLARARRACDAGQFGDAVAELQPLLGVEVEDGFVPATDGDATSTTLRREARRLLGVMPAVELRSYELQFGPQARALLEAAAGKRDRSLLARIAEEYFHTCAGYEAVMLLACDRLDRGRPLEAMAWLRRIGESDAAIEHCEPRYWLLLAMSCLSAGDLSQARQVFERLKQRCPEASIRLGERTFVAARDAREAWLALEKLAAPEKGTVKKETGPIGRDGAADAPHRSGQSPFPGLPDAAWPMFRGNAARNAPSAFGGRLGEAEWNVDLVENPRQTEQLRLTQRALIDRENRPQPALHPLCVAGTLLARTPSQLVAVDLASGRRQWEYPWEKPSLDDPIPNNNLPFLIAGPPPADPATERAFLDAAYGQFSSDGRLVFLLDRLAIVSAQPFPPVAWGRGVVRARPAFQRSSSNQLVALRLDGKLAWSVGCESGEDEPKLAKAFFLGPPLPDGPWLYVLAEIKGEIALCVLHAATGRLEWSSPIAHPSAAITRDLVRRLAGAVPSMADGVLVCPTSAGAVVGIDPVTRCLLWGYPYARAQHGRATWADAAVTIADRRVLLTPPDCELLCCLDLFSGRELWSCRREDYLFVACVHEGKVVLVGPRELTALRLADRKPAWKSPVKLPAEGMPSGRGLYRGRFYYLPTTARHLLEIDLEEGRIARTLETEQALGNLLGLGDRLLSQTADRVELLGPPK